MAEIIVPIVSAVATAIVTWFLTRQSLQNDLWQKNQLLAQFSELEAEVDKDANEIKLLVAFKDKYQSVRNNLESSSVVKHYLQPVILLGPRAVGKTSLLMQWHAPWEHGRLNPTQSHKITTVPVYDFEMPDREPHFADPEITTTVEAHLKLRVHDFPGELGAQQSVTREAIADTEEVRSQTGKSLGVVLICMFDASEAVRGVQSSTISYYNGDLFANLRNLVSHRNVDIQRLVLVFNKYDLLRGGYPGETDRDLLNRCNNTFEQVLSLLHGICNPEKVCEVTTILDRDDMITNNRGAPIVLGEAARGLIEVMAGPSAARELLPDGATRLLAAKFPTLP